MKNSKAMMMKILVRCWLKKFLLLELEEVHKNKMREAWKHSWSGLVWEYMNFWNIRKNILRVILAIFDLFC